MDQTTEVLVVTRSLALQQGLGALLESLPGITHVKAVRELTNAFAWIKSHQPRIVFLDSVVLGNDPEAVLEMIQLISPHTRRVLLVDNVQGVEWTSKYAEAILIKGIAPSAIAEIVSKLLVGKGD